MATQTTNLHLIKPALNDPADIGDINDNMDIIDGLLPRLVRFNNGNTITSAGTYSANVTGITNYYRPAQIILSDESAVLSNWSWTVSSGSVSLVIPTGGIKSSGTTVTFLLILSDNNT